MLLELLLDELELASELDELDETAGAEDEATGSLEPPPPPPQA
ncbi:hypothetical protein GCM10011613_06130 [Cellvibrio zantedeschiae]|uniref:Uncharacterized protein n=1 Tax=Cellvibrio zantedeschiae TaxID=1237077 RepID=A0ABQ3AV45_9GAMM|nr:hypothetical protein GCM10011613_06130 [Cellvibrio zantedeschiae]